MKKATNVTIAVTKNGYIVRESEALYCIGEAMYCISEARVYETWEALVDGLCAVLREPEELKESE